MLDFDLLHNPYSSGRMPLVARNGVVATSQPLAAQAGLTILQRGGNAIDAAVATAIALTVLEPTSNGIGGDAFALVWADNQLHGLNGSGRAPHGLTLDLLRAAPSGDGTPEMPKRGWLPVTVPGAPRAWYDLHQRWGKLPFAALFEPAINYAEHGYAPGPVLAFYWQLAAKLFGEHTAPCFRGWQPTFAPNGVAPHASELWRSPDHARTLRRLAASDCEDFYHGELAQAITQFAAETGGVLAAADLAGHTSTWVQPINTTYGGFDVWEIPPNGQGLAALIALNLLDGLELGRYPRDSVEAYHLQIEAMKLAFADAHRYIADPDYSAVPVADLLDHNYAMQRRTLIGSVARQAEAGTPPKGGTVLLCTADADGMMVSMIQSNYMGFGSGVVIPGTGIALQNRGAGFSLEPGHPNELAPGKRPFHTIIPGFLSLAGQPVGPFGVMGGFMQPQGHVQLIVNTITYGLHPQASLDAPRWQWMHDLQIELEQATASHIVQGLSRRGHAVILPPTSGDFGRGQIIWRLPNGTYIAGSDGRTDGCAVGY